MFSAREDFEGDSPAYSSPRILYTHFPLRSSSSSFASPFFDDYFYIQQNNSFINQKQKHWRIFHRN